MSTFISFNDFKTRARGALNMLNDKKDTFQRELIALMVQLPEIKNYPIDMPCIRILASFSGVVTLEFFKM